MGKIPDRWLNYSTHGKQIDNSKIICFKTPLRKSVDVGPMHKEWSVETLVESVPNIGLIIDLTYSSKYYSPHDVTVKGIEHKKILCKGHHVPNAYVVKSFMDTINHFISRNRHNDKLIGVHCTHGVNRTGYLVCRYLIDRLGYSPSQAIDAFKNARGHQLERENYVNDLLMSSDNYYHY